MDSEAPTRPDLTVAATRSAEPVREGQAISAENLAWEGPERRAAPGDVPVLQVEGFEGPLDWLLEQVRAHRVDLARLSVLALIEQCAAAIEAALVGRHGEGRGEGASSVAVPASVPLQRLADWVVMAAWLAWLRSRLLLPADDPEAAAARDEAEALRRQLADRARVRDAVAWLDSRPQLGRDVFARGGEVSAPAKAERAADLPALLRTYARLMGPMAEHEKDAVYRPRPPPLWRVPDALARITRLLPGLLGDGAASEGADLWQFLPDADAWAAAGLAPDTVPDPAVLSRSAVASTLVAGLELARQGQLMLGQEDRFGTVLVHGAPSLPSVDHDGGSYPADASLKPSSTAAAR